MGIKIRTSSTVSVTVTSTVLSFVRVTVGVGSVNVGSPIVVFFNGIASVAATVGTEIFEIRTEVGTTGPIVDRCGTTEAVTMAVSVLQPLVSHVAL